jgi:transcriptional regulator with XRE-family HTH domain
VISRVAEEAKDLRDFLDQLRSEPGYWKHFAILQFTTAMARLMKKPPRVSGKKLAELLGVTPPSVSKALSGGENLTIETMTKMAGALNAAVHIHLAKKGTLVRWMEEETSEAVQDENVFPVTRLRALQNPRMQPSVGNASIVVDQDAVALGDESVKMTNTAGAVIYTSAAVTSNDWRLEMLGAPVAMHQSQGQQSTFRFALAQTPHQGSLHSLTTRPS